MSLFLVSGFYTQLSGPSFQPLGQWKCHVETPLRYVLTYTQHSSFFFLTVCIGQMLYLIWHITVKLPPFRAPQNWSLAIAFHPSRLSFLSCHQPSLSLRRSLAFALLLCKQHGWDMMFTTGSRAGSGLQAQCDGSTNNP